MTSPESHDRLGPSTKSWSTDNLLIRFEILPEHSFEGVSFGQFHNTEDSDKARHTKNGNARAIRNRLKLRIRASVTFSTSYITCEKVRWN